MVILLSILTIAGFAGTVLFGFALKKYQKLYYEVQVTNKKQADEAKHIAEEKDNTIKAQQNHNSELEKKVLNFDNEKQEIYQKALVDGQSSAASPEQITNLENEISIYKDEIERLEFQNQELSENHQLDNKEKLQIYKQELINLIFAIQEKHLTILNNKLNLEKLQLSNNNTPLTIVPLGKILSSINLEEETDLITQYNPDDKNKIDYSIVFSANNIAFMIDGIFTEFLIKNQTIFANINDKSKNEINTVLRARIDYLANQNLKDNIIDALNTLERPNNFSKILSCLYIPSEGILRNLIALDANLFKYAAEKDITIFSPTGLINLINEARFLSLSENSLSDLQELYNFTNDKIDNNDDIKTLNNIVEQTDDILNDIIDSNNLTTSVKDSSEINLEADPEISTTNDAVTKQNELSHNIAENEGLQSNKDASLLEESDSFKNEVDLDNPADDFSDKLLDQNLGNEDNNHLAVSSDKESSIDKLNIGSFLEGGVLKKEQLDSVNQQITTESDNTESVIKEIDDSEQVEEIYNTNAEAVHKADDSDNNDEESDDQQTKEKAKSTNANPDDFDIESFLNS
ncbi:MAG: DNA recombination protein RmuC [Alphaproteobacteria bacterium]|jgi:hypothetical protein|nr:DNA recombination protein RmuC [Alphaproteobacteria bacterium]MBT5827552.1 DNA recombination protein RmuC [Alphaproteobacteria bacterium]